MAAVGANRRLNETRDALINRIGVGNCTIIGDKVFAVGTQIFGATRVLDLVEYNIVGDQAKDETT